MSAASQERKTNDREYFASSETEYSAIGEPTRPSVGVCQALNSPFNLQTPKRTKPSCWRGRFYSDLMKLNQNDGGNRRDSKALGVSERHWTDDWSSCVFCVNISDWELPTFSLPIFGLAKFNGFWCVYKEKWLFGKQRGDSMPEPKDYTDDEDLWSMKRGRVDNERRFIADFPIKWVC